MDCALVLFIIGLLWIRPSREGSLTGELPVRGPSKTIVIPRLCSHFLSCIFALNFVLTPDLCPSPPIYTLVSMGQSWWRNIWSVRGPFHPWGLGGFLSLIDYSIMPCHVSKRGPTICRRSDTLVTYAQRWIPRSMGKFSQGTALYLRLIWTLVGKFAKMRSFTYNASLYS